MRHVVNGERRPRTSKVLTGAFVPRLRIVTPFGRMGETIGAPSRRIEELAARNIGSLDPKFGSFCPGGYGHAALLNPFRQAPVSLPVRWSNPPPTDPTN